MDKMKTINVVGQNDTICKLGIVSLDWCTLTVS